MARKASVFFPPRPPPPANRIGGVGSISREKCKFLAVSVRYWRKGSEARAGPVRERPLKTWNLVELRWIHTRTGPHGRVLGMSEANQRVGIFGGTFDPVHLGHLIMAEQCREQVELDAVWFIPSARPPHKPDRTLTPFRQRVEMLELALAGYPVFRVDELEELRAGPSYTVETLEVLAEQH